MNNLIIHPEYFNLKEKLEKLKAIITEKIAKKDDLIFHECKNIETNYMIKIGHLEFKIFEIKLNIHKIKRQISLIQKQVNLQREVDLDFIYNQIEIEFEKYILELAEKGAKINIALNRRDLKPLSKKEAIEIRKTYKELILKLHPDLNNDIDKKGQDLFLQVMDAYEAADLESLKVLKVLASDISKNLVDEEDGMKRLKEDIDFLEIRIKLIDKEIEEIKNSYPYNKKELIYNDEKLEKNKQILDEELNNQLEIFNKYKQKLDDLLKAI
ncbi:MAG: DnaJ domain-containing protein [Methanobrevibacter sp.]|nr:DnaJ domain-containing protein [Methanobrevibacter sp.]